MIEQQTKSACCQAEKYNDKKARLADNSVSKIAIAGRPGS
jgi:hypothetical protein